MINFRNLRIFLIYVTSFVWIVCLLYSNKYKKNIFDLDFYIFQVAYISSFIILVIHWLLTLNKKIEEKYYSATSIFNAIIDIRNEIFSHPFYLIRFNSIDKHIFEKLYEIEIKNPNLYSSNIFGKKYQLLFVAVNHNFILGAYLISILSGVYFITQIDNQFSRINNSHWLINSVKQYVLIYGSAINSVLTISFLLFFKLRRYK